MNGIFDGAEVICSYTRQQAIEDGIFVDVTEMAKEAGFGCQVVVTTNLFHTYIKPNEDADFKGRLWDTLNMTMNAIRANPPPNEYMWTDIKVKYGNKVVNIWACAEDNGVNVMLPEDY